MRIPDYPEEKITRCMICNISITVPNAPGPWACGECVERKQIVESEPVQAVQEGK